MNIDRSTKTNFDYWRELVGKIPEFFKNWFEEEKKYLQKIIIPNAKVLDVGCGDGRSIYDIISITRNIIGIDHDERAISLAKSNFSKYPSIQFLNIDARSLSFNNESFDFIICTGNAFGNFGEDKFVILKEMKRVLKNYGKIILSVYSEDAFEERVKVYKALGFKIKRIKDDGTVIFDESVRDNISEQFSREQLENIFSQAGLRIEDIKKIGIAYLCTLTK